MISNYQQFQRKESPNPNYVWDKLNIFQNDNLMLLGLLPFLLLVLTLNYIQDNGISVLGILCVAILSLIYCLPYKSKIYASIQSQQYPPLIFFPYWWQTQLQELFSRVPSCFLTCSIWLRVNSKTFIRPLITSLSSLSVASLVITSYPINLIIILFSKILQHRFFNLFYMFFAKFSVLYDRMSWKIQSILNRPTSHKSALNNSSLKTFFSFPLSKWFSFSVIGYKMIIGSIKVLIPKCIPFAVFFGVISIGIYAVNGGVSLAIFRAMFLITFVGISVKFIKIQPFIANLYSSTAVTLKTIMFRIKTALLHRTPYLVEPCSSLSMSHIISLTSRNSIVNQFCSSFGDNQIPTHRYMEESTQKMITTYRFRLDLNKLL